jgi:hypothetical protein
MTDKTRRLADGSRKNLGWSVTEADFDRLSKGGVARNVPLNCHIKKGIQK